MQQTQFRVLYRVFLLRVVDLELISADGDPTKLLGQLASIFATMSFFLCAPLILNGAQWNQSNCWMMERLFLALTMLVVGLFAVLSWDSIFPDKRDLLVLAPLPVKPRTIFRAKLAALGYAMALLVLALNIFTGLLWPAVLVPVGGFLSVLRTYAAFWISMLAAGSFLFFAVLTLQGIASQLLPRQLFLRASAFIQIAAFCLLLGDFAMEPWGVTAGVLQSPTALNMPTYWFLGLFQVIGGASGPLQPVFAELAQRAVLALGVVFCGACASLLLFYLRMLDKVVEAPDILPSSRRWNLPLPASALLTGAITVFALRTLLRSRPHRVILSFFYGVGMALSIPYAYALFKNNGWLAQGAYQDAGPILASSIVILCMAVAGLRNVASMPIALPANWIFRITELNAPAAYLRAIRRAMFVCGVLPVWIGSGVFLCAFLPWKLVAQHLLVLALVGGILVEICLYSFRKIPFTCSYLPGKGNLHFAFWACAVVLLPVIGKAAQWETELLATPVRFAAMILVLGASLLGVRRGTASTFRPMETMQFDESESPLVQTLSLSRY
jgi:hypothetical protein